MKAMVKNLLVAFLFFFMTVANVYAQPNIKGKVTDEDGQVLVGVAVLVSGTSNGTVTDADGNYSITVKKGDVLLFTSLGYADQSFNCDGILS